MEDCGQIQDGGFTEFSSSDEVEFLSAEIHLQSAVSYYPPCLESREVHVVPRAVEYFESKINSLA